MKHIDDRDPTKLGVRLMTGIILIVYGLLLICILLTLTTQDAEAGHDAKWRYKVQSGPTVSYACVQVIWKETEADVIKQTGAAGMLYPKYKADGTIDSSQWQLMVVPKPKGYFNDHRTMEILGHEFFHALGADHD